MGNILSHFHEPQARQGCPLGADWDPADAPDSIGAKGTRGQPSRARDRHQLARQNRWMGGRKASERDRPGFPKSSTSLIWGLRALESHDRFVPMATRKSSEAYIT